MQSVPNSMGRDGFFWFQGVVEDRQDPKKLGRVRVRILGIHTDNRTLIPTQDLPWAYVMTPITSAAMTGLGESPLGPVPGTWVIGFFRDGDSCQEPVIIGTIGGIPEEPTQKPKGFYDPRDDDELVEKLANAPRKIQSRSYHTDGSGVTLTPETQAQNYPRETNPLDNVLNEPDTNRLARAEKINDTIVQVKKDNLDKQVPEAFGGTWDEPAPGYNAQYPYNHVKESESGHIEEVDDTPGAERTHSWDRSGSFQEIQLDGTKIVKVVGDHYEIIMKKDHIHIMGDRNTTVQKDDNLLCQKNLNIEVDENLNILVKGGTFIKVQGDLDFTVGGQVNFKSGGNFNVDAPDIFLNSGTANPKEPKQ